MANRPSASRSLVKGLMALIKGRMTSIEQAFDDFPANNQKLKYPSFSIFTQSPTFTPMIPYIVRVGEKVADEEDPDFGKAPVLYCIGGYEFNLQLDFWCESKHQRHDIMEEFVLEFNDVDPTSGVNLKLEEYHGEWIHAFFRDVQFNSDSEISSQRNEWRFKVSVIVSMRALKEKMENLMETIESTVETTEGEIEEGSSGTGG